MLSSSESGVNEDQTIRWLAQRQIGGFQGRPGKLEDVCYSFWVGGALSVCSLFAPLLRSETFSLIEVEY